MRCPVCKSTLRWEKYQYVEFDICSDCRGIWVSGEQFHALAALVAADGEVESSAKLTFKPRRPLLSDPKNSIKGCPKCHLTMLTFNYAYDSNVFIDRCETCKGIWLDPNEIIDIAKHIQYNQTLVAQGKSYLDFVNNRDMEEEFERCAYYLQIAYTILRILVFRF